MVSRADDPMPSLAALRAAFRAVATTSDVENIVREWMRIAFHGETDKVKLSALERLASYTVGRPQDVLKVKATKFDSARLTSIEGCLDQLAVLAQAYNEGAIDEPAIKELRATVLAAINGLRTQQGEKAAEALEDLGAEFMLLEAGRERESFEEQMQAREGASE